MNNYRHHEDSLHPIISPPNDAFKQVVDSLCLGALEHARTQLHPLLQGVELNRLDIRCEFIQAFKLSLEQRIAEQLAAWQPSIQAVFKFDSPRRVQQDCWDSTIHLVIMVAQPLGAMKTLGQMLDQSLIKRLKLLNWSRFRSRQSIVNVHQVTPDEVRHGMSYGALFGNVHTAPVKIWPQEGFYSRA